MVTQQVKKHDKDIDLKKNPYKIDQENKRQRIKVTLINNKRRAILTDITEINIIT